MNRDHEMREGSKLEEMEKGWGRKRHQVSEVREIFARGLID